MMLKFQKIKKNIDNPILIKFSLQKEGGLYVSINEKELLINLNVDYTYNPSEVITKIKKIDINHLKPIGFRVIDFDNKYLFQLLLEIIFSNFAKVYSKKTSVNIENIIYFDGELSQTQQRQIEYMQSLYWAKYLGDLDSLDDGTPESICKIIKEHFKDLKNIELNIYNHDEIKKIGLNLIDTVGKSSKNKPHMIELVFMNNKKTNNVISIVGKGVTFDAGGYALKSSDSIRTMRLDKCGGANAIAIFDYIVKNKIAINLVVIVPLCENVLTANAILPSQVIQAYSKKTIQIDNPDAEGRLILADAIAWVQKKYKVDTLISIATLTGAITIPLGKYMTGLFSNKPELTTKLIDLANAVGDEVWLLPIHWQNRKAVFNAELADLTNSPSIKYGGSSQAAAFLEAFITNETTFFHFDIGGTGVENNRATGVMVKGIINFLTDGNEGGYYERN